ncbi:MAG TPA: alpha/beta fold hydrolase [Candidatus Limnocylindria bacterium]|nr:alpha/beta fold hydrolase [Candidatus Limnocylindria bacterium]
MYTHGITSTVFRQTHVRVGRELQRAGYTVVAGNNRGTALATPLLRRAGPRILGGSWFERVEDAAKDIDAWIAVATAGGAKRIVLFGHSLGAIKAILYASERRAALAGLVLASPPLRAFARPPEAEALARARRAVDEGRPQELIELANPLTFGRTSAATLLSRAALGDPASLLRQVAVPILAIYGTEEADTGGQEDLDRMRQLVAGSFAGAMIAGADHMYTGHEAAAAEVIGGWIGSRVMLSAESSLPL